MSDARRDRLEQFQQLRPYARFADRRSARRRGGDLPHTPACYYLDEDCLPLGIRSETVAFVPSGAVSRSGTVPVLRPLG